MDVRKLGKGAALLVAFCLLIAAIGVGVSYAAPTYKLSGAVTFAGASSDASAAVTARAYTWAWNGSAFAWLPTGSPASVEASTGAFSLTGLPAGTYRVGFTDASAKYFPVFYDSTSTVDAATDVSIVDTDAVDAFTQDLTLIPQPRIKGHVGHTAGDWADASISVIPYAYEYHLTVGNAMAWEWVPQPGSDVATDGTYSIEGLAPGTYRFAFEDSKGVYNTRYFDSVDTSIGAATDVVWSGAADLTIDNTVTASPQRKLAGTVHFIGATPVEGDVNAEVYSQDASGTWVVGYSAPVAADGAWSVHPTADATGIVVGFSDSSGVFGATFYGGESTADSSTPFALTAPQTVAGVDTTMTAKTSQRLSGYDAVETALLSSASYDDGWGGPVILASADTWADAVCAGPYAHSLGAPVLLIHKDSVPQEVLDEIGRLDASEVVIIGSPTAVTFSVENDLRQSGVGIVRRLGGSDAYGTSAAVAQEMVTRGLTVTGDGGKLVNVAVVGGLNLKTPSPYDAMCAAPIAAKQDMPLLLVKKASVPVAVADFLAANESTETNVLLVGGESIVSADVEPQLTPADPASANEDYVSPVVRVSGADRYATSVAVAKLAMEGYGFSPRKAALSTLNSAPEVLALSPVLANRDEPLLLTAPILKRKAVADSPGAYTWMSPVTEVFISKQTAPTLDPSGELANANIAVLDSIGRVNTDVWNYALKEAGIK